MGNAQSYSEERAWRQLTRLVKKNKSHTPERIALSKIMWNLPLLSGVAMGATFLVSASTMAADVVPANPEFQHTEGVTDAPEVAALADVPPASANFHTQPKQTFAPNIQASSPISDTSPPQVAETYLAESTHLADAANTENLSATSSLETLEQTADDGNEPMAQVTIVSQLRDVEPTDWAYEALRSLVERYGCIAGYPDGTFRGNRALSRYEFAAGLNACLAQIERLIAASGADALSKDALESLQRLQEEFARELSALGGRVDALQARTAQLEASQFSTTTKLNGEIIFALGGVFGEDAADRDDNPDNNPDLEDNAIFADRVRLNFDTSFTGKDRLRTRFQARNITPFDDDITGTRMTRLGFDGDDNNDVELDDIYYRFPLGDKATVYLAAAATEFNDIVDTLNPLLESSSGGAISRFGRFNPIYRASDGAGVGVVYEFSDRASLTLGYLAQDAEDPSQNNGLFNGNYGALAQLAFEPIRNLDIGLTYVRAYYGGDSNSGVNITGSTGSENALRPFGDVATSADSFGLETSFRISPRFTLSGWLGYSFANSKVTDDNANIFNFAVNLAFPDLGKKGNIAGIVFGMPPKVIDNSISGNEDNDTSLHLEAFYRWQLTNNISITPGVFMITNPEHNANNDTIFVGTVRTTFRF
jgi:hypothetical protein